MDNELPSTIVLTREQARLILGALTRLTDVAATVNDLGAELEGFEAQEILYPLLYPRAEDN